MQENETGGPEPSISSQMRLCLAPLPDRTLAGARAASAAPLLPLSCALRSLAPGTATLAALQLRPCEHQVAGHLFEDGKAGSLIDDRGHFYKPLQRGPRGDRERSFYDAIDATLRAEAAASQQQQKQQEGQQEGQQCGSSPGGCPRNGACGVQPQGSTGGSGSVGGSPSGRDWPALPWKSSRQLLRLFPSFKAQGERLPIAVAQRDELGLLSNSLMPQLSLGSSQASQPTSPLVDGLGEVPSRDGRQQQQQEGGRSPPSQQQQQGSASFEQQQQQQQQGAAPFEQLQAPRQLRRACSASEELEGGGGGEDGAPESGLLSLQYGRSPDSDDCAELTGRHLMKAFHASGRGGSPGGGSDEFGEAELSGPAGQRAKDAAAEAAVEEQQQQEGHKQLQQQQLSAEHGQQQRLEQQARERRHATSSAGEAYTRPEHAQVSALLGQPVYDASLSGLRPAAAPLAVLGSSKPHRSPFMSELLHHAHPPGPQERRRLAGGEAAALGAAGSDAAAGGGGADGLAEGAGSPVVPAASCEASWLSDAEQEAGEGEAQQQRQRSPEPAASCSAPSGSRGSAGSAGLASLPFSVRNAPLLRVIPKYYGTHAHSDGRVLLELEDLARAYRHPCIMDIKIGFRTWYPGADASYIQRCREKDETTTQAALGFKICGMQVYRHGAGGYWRASKRWCKTLPVELVDKALLSFAHNEHGLRPCDIYGGPAGALAQLEALEGWFAVQSDFHFYSSSVLLLYEGEAASPEQAKVRVRLVDFAHTFFQGEEDGEASEQSEGQSEGQAGSPAPAAPASASAAPGASPSRRPSAGHGPFSAAPARGTRDANFLAGLRALLARLRGVVHSSLQAELT